MLVAQSQATQAQARLLLGERFQRMDATVQGGRFGLDTARPEQIDQLIQLGRGEAVKKANLERAQALFLNGEPATAFEPVVAPSG